MIGRALGLGALLAGALAVGAIGCGPKASSSDGAGGSQAAAAEDCHWCAEAAPFVRVCASTMIASGGQLVCVDEGESRLCEAPTACRR